MNETPPILSQTTTSFETSSSPPRTRRRINIQNTSSNIETPPPVASVPRSQEENALEEEFQQIIDDLNELDLVDADGGDSDIEGEECEIFDTSYASSVMERANNEESEVHVKEINNGDIAFVLANKGVIREEDENINFEEMVKQPPDDWVKPDKKDPIEPDFESVDNPGGWNDYIFRPIYKNLVKGKMLLTSTSDMSFQLAVHHFQ